MPATQSAEAARQARRDLTQHLFPHGIPRLWCPALTHFSAPGTLDAPRIRRHLAVLAPYVKGLLVPGSTGEGWELTDGDSRDLLAIVLEAARAADVRVLIGILKTDLAEMLQGLDAAWAFLQRLTGTTDQEEVLLRSGVVGFTVCPPKGRHLDQPALAAALRRVLARGLPVALYQLPQVTENELQPETVQTLAAEFPNAFLFKDTSGQDRVAASGLDLHGLFLVRGAEGDYARWLKPVGGPYDGFLLSTANVFARQLDTLLTLLDQGRPADARALAERLSRVVAGCFQLVAGFPTGNPFTNANKVLDHLMAYGEAAPRIAPPLLASGVRLPADFVTAAADLLRHHDLLPGTGYLA